MSVECSLHDTLDDSKAAARQPGRVLGGESLCRPLGQTGHQIGLEEENAKDGGQEMVRVCKPALRTQHTLRVRRAQKGASTNVPTASRNGVVCGHSRSASSLR